MAHLHAGAILAQQVLDHVQVATTGGNEHQRILPATSPVSSSSSSLLQLLSSYCTAEDCHCGLRRIRWCRGPWSRLHRAKGLAVEGRGEGRLGPKSQVATFTISLAAILGARNRRKALQAPWPFTSAESGVNSQLLVLEAFRTTWFFIWGDWHNFKLSRTLHFHADMCCLLLFLKCGSLKFLILQVLKEA